MHINAYFVCYVIYFNYICIRNKNLIVMSREELNQLCREYQQILLMSEEEACEFCNADSKAEAVQSYEEEIDFWEKRIK